MQRSMNEEDSTTILPTYPSKSQRRAAAAAQLSWQQQQESEEDSSEDHCQYHQQKQQQQQQMQQQQQQQQMQQQQQQQHSLQEQQMQLQQQYHVQQQQLLYQHQQHHDSQIHVGAGAASTTNLSPSKVPSRRGPRAAVHPKELSFGPLGSLSHSTKESGYPPTKTRPRGRPAGNRRSRSYEDLNRLGVSAAQGGGEEGEGDPLDYLPMTR